jgi:hypothetical protein
MTFHKCHFVRVGNENTINGYYFLWECVWVCCYSASWRVTFSLQNDGIQIHLPWVTSSLAMPPPPKPKQKSFGWGGPGVGHHCHGPSKGDLPGRPHHVRVPRGARESGRPARRSDTGEKGNKKRLPGHITLGKFWPRVWDRIPQFLSQIFWTEFLSFVLRIVKFYHTKTQNKLIKTNHWMFSAVNLFPGWTETAIFSQQNEDWDWIFPKVYPGKVFHEQTLYWCATQNNRGAFFFFLDDEYSDFIAFTPLKLGKNQGLLLHCLQTCKSDSLTSLSGKASAIAGWGVPLPDMTCHLCFSMGCGRDKALSNTIESPKIGAPNDVKMALFFAHFLKMFASHSRAYESNFPFIQGLVNVFR